MKYHVNLNINLEEYLENAKSLGIEVELNSDKPGVFIEENGREIEVDSRYLFPELKALENETFETFIIPEIVAHIVENNELIRVENNNAFSESKQLIGAA